MRSDSSADRWSRHRTAGLFLTHGEENSPSSWQDPHFLLGCPDKVSVFLVRGLTVVSQHLRGPFENSFHPCVQAVSSKAFSVALIDPSAPARMQRRNLMIFAYCLHFSKVQLPSCLPHTFTTAIVMQRKHAHKHLCTMQGNVKWGVLGYTFQVEKQQGAPILEPGFSLREHIQAWLTGLDALWKDSCLHNGPPRCRKGVQGTARQLCEEEACGPGAGPPSWGQPPGPPRFALLNHYHSQ